MQRTFDTVTQIWAPWAQIGGVPKNLTKLSAVQWNKKEITILLYATDSVWSIFGNGTEWNNCEVAQILPSK